VFDKHKTTNQKDGFSPQKPYFYKKIIMYLPSDFHTSPFALYFKKEPDYTFIEQKIEFLGLFAKMNKQNICIIDFYRHNYFYISFNHLFSCGYTYEAIKQMGQGFPCQIICEEDKQGELEMKNAACRFLSTLDKETQKKASVFSTHRFTHKNGKNFSICNQYKPILFDDNGKVWMFIGISNLSTKNYFIESYIEFEGKKERYLFSKQKKEFVLSDHARLSQKEIDVLVLATQGYTSKEVASMKNISLSTVKFHKQNILFKLNVQNIQEAIMYAYSHKLYDFDL
jgi:DNA-binding CsgD family transcriptional regulator